MDGSQNRSQFRRKFSLDVEVFFPTAGLPYVGKGVSFFIFWYIFHQFGHVFFILLSLQKGLVCNMKEHADNQSFRSDA
jgi:hypothetical protein